VAQRVERWTCDQQVMGSNHTQGKSCVTALTACTPGSAQGPTLGNEYGKPLPLPFFISANTEI